ncbi:MAG: hypothetical protein KIT36_07565 [Alphaproteobacteria bacterium]|nr:hypothetical protein [Alphaproteobacteria bacterium]
MPGTNSTANTAESTLLAQLQLSNQMKDEQMEMLIERLDSLERTLRQYIAA